MQPRLGVAVKFMDFYPLPVVLEAFERLGYVFLVLLCRVVAVVAGFEKEMSADLAIVKG